MDRDQQSTVSLYVHEAEMARQERYSKRLWILCIIMFLALVISNASWIWYESQFEDIYTTEWCDSNADNGGVATANGSGEVSYGKGAVY